MYLVRWYNPSIRFAVSGPSPGSLERFDLYGIFHIVYCYFPYIIVGHQADTFPHPAPRIPRPVFHAPDSKVIEEVSFQ